MSMNLNLIMNLNMSMYMYMCASRKGRDTRPALRKKNKKNVFFRLTIF